VEEPQADEIGGHIRRAASDAAMIGRGIREGWNLDRGEKQRIKNRMLDVLDNTEKPRDAARVTQTFLAMDEADRQADGGPVGLQGNDERVTVNLVVNEVKAVVAGKRELLPGLPMPGFETKHEE